MSFLVKSSPNSYQLYSYPSEDQLGYGEIGTLDGAITFGEAVISGHVVVTRAFTGAVTTPVVRITGAVSKALKPTGSLTFGTMTSSGAATVYRLNAATSEISMGAMTSTGAASYTPAPVTHTTTGEIEMTAMAASGASVKHELHATAKDLTLPIMSVVGAASVGRLFGVSGGLTMGVIGAIAAAKPTRIATGAIDLIALDINGAVARNAFVSGAITLPVISLSGEANSVSVYTSNGRITTLPFTLAAETALTRFASGAIVMPAVVIAGSEHKSTATTGAMTMAAIKTYGRGTSDNLESAQLYRVIEIRCVYGKNYKLAVLEATRKPINV